MSIGHQSAPGRPKALIDSQIPAIPLIGEDPARPDGMLRFGSDTTPEGPVGLFALAVQRSAALASGWSHAKWLCIPPSFAAQNCPEVDPQTARDHPQVTRTTWRMPLP